MSTLPPLSSHLQSYSWRPLTSADGDSLHALLQAEPGAHAATVESLRARLESSTSLGVFQGADLIAGAWSYRHPQVNHERRLMLDGMVHPAYRGQGIGHALLAWAELQARAEIVTNAAQPAILRIDRLNPPDTLAAFYQSAGFEVAVSEDEMRFDLHQPIPNLSLDPAFTLESWTTQNASDFFAMYTAAFRERPGFPNWPEATWRTAFTEHAVFRADLSLLGRENGAAFAYAICHVEGDEGQIVQIGTHPHWRKRGVAGALLCALLRRFQQEGLDHALLEVATNNPEAARVYARLGFVRIQRYVGFRKPLDPA